MSAEQNRALIKRFYDAFDRHDGDTRFEVRATDSAGNSDPSAASQSWTVKKKKKK